MLLPRAIPKPTRQASRWRSPAHRRFVTSRACAGCGSTVNIEAAHVRIGSGAGMGAKPDDYRVVGLCGGPAGCHARQHRVGERTFWGDRDVEALIRAYVAASPKRQEIERVMREPGRGR